MLARDFEVGIFMEDVANPPQQPFQREAKDAVAVKVVNDAFNVFKRRQTPAVKLLWAEPFGFIISFGSLHDVDCLLDKFVELRVICEKDVSQRIMECLCVVVCPNELVVLTNQPRPEAIYPGSFKVVVDEHQRVAVDRAPQFEKTPMDVAAFQKHQGHQRPNGVSEVGVCVVGRCEAVSVDKAQNGLA